MGAGAVEQGFRSLAEDPFSLLNFHILVSTVCIVCYIVAVFTGRKLLKSGLQAGRRAHKVNACVFIVTRLAGPPVEHHNSAAKEAAHAP